VTALSLTITFVLVLANAFFVASEFAIVKMRPTRLEQLIKEGNSRAKLALQMSQRLDAYLSANQLGITLASIGIGWVGEPVLAELVEPLFAPLERWAHVGAHALAFVLAFLIITGFHSVIGELAPKALAIQKTESVTLATVYPLHVFYLMAWPIIRLLQVTANGFIRLMGLRPVGGEEMAHTSEELRMLLAQSPAQLDPATRSMLVRIFDLRRRTARHVMSLRVDAATLRAGMTIDEAVKVVTEAGYSRYPVLDDAGKGVLGYLHLRDLFDVLCGRKKAARVAELLRKPIFARESTSVDRLRSEMQARQVPVAFVLSPTNEFVGIVTMEDLLEEIVGEIRDENDGELAPLQRRGDGILDLDGRLLLHDLEREAGIVLAPVLPRIETVGGYMLARLGRPPEAGETVECEEHTLIALDVVGRRVRRVRLVPLPKEGEAAGEEKESEEEAVS